MVCSGVSQQRQTQKSLNTIEVGSKIFDFVLLNLRDEQTVAAYD